MAAKFRTLLISKWHPLMSGIGSRECVTMMGPGHLDKQAIDRGKQLTPLDAGNWFEINSGRDKFVRGRWTSFCIVIAIRAELHLQQTGKTIDIMGHFRAPLKPLNTTVL